MKEELGQRIELLQRRVTELMEQQKAIERQIKAYKELIRHYRAVYEAEHGLGMEGQLTPTMIENLEKIIAEAESDKTTKQYKSVPEAVLEVLSEKKKALHATQVSKAVVQKYPDMEERVKDIGRQVVVALVRGTQQGLYEHVGRNIYQLKKKER
jgi:hypothetical protein